MSPLLPYLFSVLVLGAPPVANDVWPVALQAAHLELGIEQGSRHCGEDSQSRISRPPCTRRWTLLAERLTLRSKDLVFMAGSANLTMDAQGRPGGTLEEIQLSGCACSSPPWMVVSEAAELQTEGYLWLYWPTFHWYGTPLALAPLWPVPTEKRASGFLFPRGGWSSAAGPYGEQRFFWVLGHGADLTPSLGYARGIGPFATLSTRFVNRRSAHNNLTLEGREGGVRGHGQAALGVGPLHLDFRGEANSSVSFRRERVHRWEDAMRGHTFARGGASLRGERWGFGLLEEMVEDHRTATGSVRGGRRTAGLWYRPRYGDALLVFGTRASQEWLDGRGLHPLLQSNLEMVLPLWVGPLRLEGRSGLHGALSHDPDGASTTAGVGHASMSGEVFVRKNLAPRSVHWMGVRAQGRVQSFHGENLSARRHPLVEPASPWQTTVTLENRLMGGETDGRLRIHGLFLGPDDDAPDFAVQGRMATGFTMVEAWTYGRRLSAVEMRIGPLGGPGLFGGWARQDAQAGGSGWFPRESLELPVVMGSTAAQTESIALGGDLPWGPLHLRWQGAFDPSLVLTAQSGGMVWQGACHCWHARIEAWILPDRDQPEVTLGIALEPAEFL